MVESVFANSGRSCINCSGIWASRHTREIADALARRLADVRPLPPQHPDAGLAAFTVPGAAEAISQAIDADLQTPGVADVTAKYREGGRVVKEGTADYLLPTVVHCNAPEAAVAKAEYMFSLRERGGMPAGEDARRHWPDARLQRHHRSRGVPSAAARCGSHRPAEPGSCSHDAAQLAPAARGQHRGISVPRACVSNRSAGELMRR